MVISGGKGARGAWASGSGGAEGRPALAYGGRRHREPSDPQCCPLLRHLENRAGVLEAETAAGSQKRGTSRKERRSDEKVQLTGAGIRAQARPPEMFPKDRKAVLRGVDLSVPAVPSRESHGLSPIPPVSP